MKKEIWKSIPGHSIYEASTFGRIRSVDRMVKYGRHKNAAHTRFVSGRILNLHRNSTGYIQVGIYSARNKKHITYNVHALIALIFLGPKPEGLEVSHLNGDKFDNRIENLKYVTAKENTSHKYIHGTIFFGEKNPSSKLKNEDILNIRKLVSQRIRHKEIAKQYGIHWKHIWKIHTRMCWAHLA